MKGKKRVPKDWGTWPWGEGNLTVGERGLVHKIDKINADGLAELLPAQPDFLKGRPGVHVEIGVQSRGHFVLWIKPQVPR